MKAGVCTIALQHVDVFAAIDRAADAGADGVEIWGKPPHIGVPVDEKHCTAVRRHAESRGVALCAFGSYYRAGARETVDGVELTEDSQLQVAGWLGTPRIRIWAGRENYGDSTPESREAVYKDIRSFAEAAGNRGIRIVLERHSNTLTNDWNSPETVLQAVGHDNVRLNYQLVYPAAADEMAAAAAEDFRVNLSLADHAHLQNYLQSEDGTLERSFLDEGIVDYGAFTGAARSCGFDGYCMVEFMPVERNGLSDVKTLERDIGFIHSL